MYVDKVKNNLLKLLKNKNHPNICLFGDNISHDIIIENLNKLHKINKNTIINYKGLEYIKNNIYYEFNLKKIKYKNKEIWLELINDICRSDNLFLNLKKTIIFNNYHFLNTSIQNILKVFIEKNTHITFILITLNISKVISPIKSRLLCLRIPKINNYEKWITIKKNKTNINIDDFQSYKNYNINDIIYFKNNDIKLKENKNIISNIINFIHISIIHNYEKKKTIENIKKISYYLLTIGIPIVIFYKKLLNILLNDYKLTINKKYKIINLIADSEYKYNKSYYKMIHIEYLLIELLNIIKI